MLIKTKLVVLIVLLFCLINLSGCLTKATIKESTPLLTYVPPKTIAFTVIDNRKYVVSGDKKDNFEGFNRALYGIPTSFANVRENSNLSYSDRIEELFIRSFSNAGSNLIATKSKKGSSIDTGIKNIKQNIQFKGLVIRVNDSKIDAGGVQWQYFYDYDFVVVNKFGEILFNKNFKGRDVDFQRAIFQEGNAQGKSYDYGSILSIHYKNKLSKFINDKELSGAITSDKYIVSKPEKLLSQKYNNSIEERLSNLQSLKSKGFITESEFKKKKKEILDSL